VRDAQILTKGVSTLLKSVLRVLDELRTELSETDSRDSVEFEATMRNISLYSSRVGHVVEILHRFLNYAEQSRETTLPSFEPLIRTLITHYEEPREFCLLVNPTWSYNYSYIELIEYLKRNLKPLDELYDYVGNALQSFPKYIIVITYPIAERRNAPLHAITLHEFGHFLNRCRGITNELLKHVGIQHEDLVELAGNLGVSPTDSESSEEEKLHFDLTIAALHEGVVRRIGDWIAEYVADAIASYFMGPAYFFALRNLALSHQGPSLKVRDIENSRHPPVHLRLKAVLMHLDKMGFDNVMCNGLKEEKNLWDSYLDSEPEIVSHQTMPRTLFRILDGAIQPLWSRVHQNTGDALGDICYTPAEYEDEVEQLAENLHLFLPPGELIDFKHKKIKAVSVGSIINSAYVVKLTQLDRFHRMLGAESFADRLQADTLINRLVEKGLIIHQAKLVLEGS